MITQVQGFQQHFMVTFCSFQAIHDNYILCNFQNSCGWYWTIISCWESLYWKSSLSLIFESLQVFPWPEILTQRKTAFSLGFFGLVYLLFICLFWGGCCFVLFETFFVLVVGVLWVLFFVSGGFVCLFGAFGVFLLLVIKRCQVNVSSRLFVDLSHI